MVPGRQGEVCLTTPGEDRETTRGESVDESPAYAVWCSGAALRHLYFQLLFQEGGPTDLPDGSPRRIHDVHLPDPRCPPPGFPTLRHRGAALDGAGAERRLTGAAPKTLFELGAAGTVIKHDVDLIVSEPSITPAHQGDKRG
jgi:hypothetical protein